MTVCGIIAEYNPFHNGHFYHMEQSRQLTGADYIIVVLSGSFVQRGAPAFIDKYMRTRMALEAGADLVIELPALFSCASAEDFAGAGISLLDQLGVTDCLSFGVEAKDLQYLSAAAQILVLEPPEFSAVLNRRLKEGLSFPKAREIALKSCLAKNPSQAEYMTDALSSPNNILALEYLKMLYRRHSSIRPVAIPREGADYHSQNPNEPFCSASAIRTYLMSSAAADPLQIPSAMMPSHCARLLTEHWQRTCPLLPDDFSLMLTYRLLAEQEPGCGRYLDVSEELSRRILHHLPDYHSFTRWTELLKTKQYTYTRISRILCHILLQIPQDTADLCRDNGYTDYARILGFRKNSAPLLSAIKKNSSIPILTKVSDAESLLSPMGKSVLRTELFASRLYGAVQRQKFPSCPRLPSDYTAGVMVV